MQDFLRYPYFLFNALSFTSNIIVAYIINRKSKIKVHLTLALILETTGFILGAKLLDLVANFEIYFELFEKGEALTALTSGFTFTGGLIGGVFGILLSSIITKTDVISLCKLLFPNFLLIYAVGKIGCLFTGCCSGKSFGDFTLPIQAIESILFFGLYLSTFFYRTSTAKIFIPIVLFCFLRFIIEFFRKGTDPHWLSISQVLTLFGFFSSLVTYIFLKNKKSVI